MPVTDPKTVEVANLAGKDAKQTPPASPEKPFKDLEDKLAEYNSLPNGQIDDIDEPEAPPTPEPPPAAPATPAQPPVEPASPPQSAGHPQALIDAALNLGIDERHLAPGAVSTEALLDFVVQQRLKDSMVDNLLRNAQPQPPEAPKAPPEEDDDAVIDYLEKEVGADSKLTRLLRKQAQKIKELEGRPDPAEVVKTAFSAREKVQVGERAIDAAFGKLGPKYEKLFGTGALDDMDAGPAKSKRLRVYKAAMIDFAKDSPQQIRQKIVDAANDLYGDVLQDTPASPAGGYDAPDQPPTNGKPQVRLTKEEWDKAALAKPSGKAPTKREEALKRAMESYMRETSRTGPADELEGIPG